MREIISLHVGQCGIQTGTTFWDYISHEHFIDLNGKLTSDMNPLLARTNVFFDETIKNKLVPRALLLDLDPISNDYVKSGEMGKFFSPESYINGTSSTGNNWAKGHYTYGPIILDSIMDQVRKNIEKCDCLQGFQMTHSISGGTGSGLGSLIISNIREMYPDRILSAYTVYPSYSIPDICVSPYNATLTVHQLVENSDMDFVFDNDALNRICHDVQEKAYPTLNDYNELIARSMSGITCSLRYPGYVNSDLRKMAVNLIPFPRLHFLATILTTLNPHETLSNSSTLINQNLTCSFKLNLSKFLTGAAIFRGNIPSYEIEKAIFELKNRESKYFTQWIPSNIQAVECKISPKDVKTQDLTFVGNNMEIDSMFKKFHKQFTTILKAKMYLYKYLEEGMDEMEFTEAESVWSEYISEYQMYKEEDFGGENAVE